VKYKCLIVDDEKLGRDLIKSHISQVSFLEVSAECSSAIEALQILNNSEIDLMFLDINMPNLSGIEFLKQTKNTPPTILSTAHAEYALESYDLDVIDYLLKPIQFSRFTKAVNKAIYKINPKRKHEIKADQNYPNHIFVKSEYRDIKIKTSEIKYIVAMEKYIRIFTENQKVMTLMSMSKVLELIKNENFLRIHRSYIINLKHLDFVEGNRVSINGIKLPISKANKNMLTNKIRKQ